MKIGKTGHPRYLLVQARIVLHRATTEWEEAKIDRVILAREAGIMPHCLLLGKSGQAYWRCTLHSAKAAWYGGYFGEIDASTIRRTNLEDQ